MRWIGGGTAARVGAVDAYRLPAGVVERFRSEHPELHAEDGALVETALRQWFRVLARRPKQQFALPSRAVSDLWLALVLDEGAYRLFSQEAFGAYVPHRPPPTASDEGVADAAGLRRTLAAARQDEPDAPHGLPWVFRVDATVQVLNARRYVATCGGGAECHTVAGAVCLRHLGSDRLDRRAYDPRRDKPAARLKSSGQSPTGMGGGVSGGSGGP